MTEKGIYQSMDYSIKQKINEDIQNQYLENQGHDYDMDLLFKVVSNTRKLLTLDLIEKEHSAKESLEIIDVLSSDTEKLIGTEKSREYISSLPSLRTLLFGTLDAIMEGDPASDSYSEVALCYPGFYAITNYRIGHVLYQLGEKTLGRLVTEDAHRKTGIDINPGALIGDHFFIDHGTGIVIGETAVIKDHVKLYQGVTLGALSLSKGKLLKGLKRHPTIESHVTIYSNASIFGGDTIIGEHTTIGANVYLTNSVNPYSIVFLGKEGIRQIPKVEDKHH